MRVLIANYDRPTSRALSATVSHLGAVPVEVTDMENALALACASPQPGLVIVELGAPDLSGLALLAELKIAAATLEIPVVLTSNDLAPVIVATAGALGAVAVVPTASAHMTLAALLDEPAFGFSLSLATH